MESRGAEYFCAQVLQKDVSGRLQAGEELLLFLGAPGAIPDLEDDPSRLAKTVDALTGWVGSSNYRVSGGASGRAAGAGGRAPRRGSLTRARCRGGPGTRRHRPRVRGTAPGGGSVTRCRAAWLFTKC